MKSNETSEFWKYLMILFESVWDFVIMLDYSGLCVHWKISKSRKSDWFKNDKKEWWRKVLKIEAREICGGIIRIALKCTHMYSRCFQGIPESLGDTHENPEDLGNNVIFNKFYMAEYDCIVASARMRHLPCLLITRCHAGSKYLQL